MRSNLPPMARLEIDVSGLRFTTAKMLEEKHEDIQRIAAEEMERVCTPEAFREAIRKHLRSSLDWEMEWATKQALRDALNDETLQGLIQEHVQRGMRESISKAIAEDRWHL